VLVVVPRCWVTHAPTRADISVIGHGFKNPFRVEKSRLQIRAGRREPRQAATVLVHQKHRGKMLTLILLRAREDRSGSAKQRRPDAHRHEITSSDDSITAYISPPQDKAIKDRQSGFFPRERRGERFSSCADPNAPRAPATGDLLNPSRRSRAPRPRWPCQRGCYAIRRAAPGSVSYQSRSFNSAMQAGLRICQTA
jgi:hypothetical protein